MLFQINLKKSLKTFKFTYLNFLTIKFQNFFAFYVCINARHKPQLKSRKRNPLLLKKIYEKKKTHLKLHKIFDPMKTSFI